MFLSVTSRISRQQMLKSLDKLPKLSPITMRLLSTLARRDCEVSQLAGLVEKDALLSAQLLRMANSATFSRLRRIENIPHAIAMVGLGTMRRLALGTSISNVFSQVKKAPSFSMVRFNLHSVATGTLVELISDEVPLDHPEGAFIAGLLHDVGKLMIAVGAPDLYEELLSIVAVRGTSMIECERELLEMDHTELSQLAITRWDLPEPIQWAARYHHDPDEARTVEHPRPGRLGLSPVVHKANAFTNHLGVSVLPAFGTSQQAPALEFPGFEVSEQRILERFEAEWKSLGELFG
jgi:HD-like signal output (HDOD) protein